MFTQKEKQLGKKIKSNNRLQRLRKQASLLRKKTIRLQQLRWLKGATFTKFPAGLNKTSALKRLYLPTKFKLAIERKFNLLLSFRRRQQNLRLSLSARPQITRTKAITTIKSTPSLGDASNLLRLAQKRRRLTYKLRLTPLAAHSALPAKRSGGRRRYLRRRGYRLNRVIRSLLLKRTTRKLSFRLAKAKRFTRDKGQRLHQTPGFNLSNSRFFLAAVRQETKRLSIPAVSTLPVLTTAKAWKPAGCRSPRTAINYQQALNDTKTLAKKLKSLKTVAKHPRNPGFLVKQTKLLMMYRRMKESLRSRFFRRGVLTDSLDSHPHPAGQPGINNYRGRTHRYYATRVQASVHTLTPVLPQYKARTTAGQKPRKLLRRFRPAVVLPLSWKLAATAVRLRLQQTTQETERALPTFSKQGEGAYSTPRRLPRRLKRALVTARRRNQKISKGEQKRRRLGIVRSSPAKRKVLPLPQAAKTVPALNWKKPLSRKRKAKLLSKLSCVSSTTSRLLSPRYTRSPVRSNGFAKALRSTLWTLFRAAESWKHLLAETNPQELATADTLLRKLRRGLRRSLYGVGEVIPTCLFLLKGLAAAPAEQKKLYGLLQRLLRARSTFAPALRIGSTRSTARKLQGRTSLNRYRRQLRAALSVTSPPMLALPQPAPALDPVTFGHKPPSVEATAPVVTTTATPDSVSDLAEKPVAFYPTPHTAALVSTRAHQKKRLLPRILKRRSRFVRFIPRRVKNRLLRGITVASNKIAAATTRFPAMRCAHQFYTKGNRLFATRHKKGYRVAARRLVKQSRWSRATLLRLSRRRPVWRRVPQGQQSRSSTGRTITHTPYDASNNGWRARRNRIKQRTLLRARTESYKQLVSLAVTPLWVGAASTQAALPPRLLQLATETEHKQLPLGPLFPTPSVAITAFHAAQRQLELRRTCRAARAKVAFVKTVRRISSGLYTRRKGRFLMEDSRKRKEPRGPRWVRVLSNAATPAASFAQLRPELAIAHRSHAVGSSLQLRGRLWTGVSQQLRVKKSKAATLPQTAIVNPEQERLITEMRRLHAFKSLLQGNKFGKLARLGELDLLGKHEHLGNLGTLFEEGKLSNTDKQTLLLALATDIKLCATLCVAAPAVQLQSAVTTRVSSRALLTYKEPTSTLGRDPEFFKPDAPNKKLNPVRKVRKVALLHALTRTKDSKVAPAHKALTGGSQLVTRAVRTRSAVAAARLRLYRCALLSKNVATTHISDDQEGALELMWTRARSEGRRINRHTVNRRPTSKKALVAVKNTAARFVTLNKLPVGYKKTTSTTLIPQIWINRLGRWVLSGPAVYATPRNKAQVLTKAFSTTRPWSVKTVYSGSIAKDYGRFLGDVRQELVTLTNFNKGATIKAKTASPVLRSVRLAAARAIYATRVPRVMQLAPSTAGNRFWQLRLPTEDQIRTQAEQRFRALARVQRKTAGPTSKNRKATTTARRISTPKAKSLVKKETIVPNLKREFSSYHIKDMNIFVFDFAVRNNLQAFNYLSTEEQADEKGYDLVRRAYKAALSSQEKNPKLLQLQFEQQKAVVGSLLEKLAGVAPGDKVLEWKQLPKKKTVPQKVVTTSSSKATGPKANTVGELTLAELESVLNEETKKHLKSFAALSSEARRNNSAHTLLRKSVLTSWTKVEDASTPKESPYYSDLVLAAKAYSFYGVTLDLTSRGATTLKLAASFAKLSK